ncbi:MAG: TldD/PmbA family protein [Ruminococcaceae bacterium]|nr:TldD/PmbA family protein [Oscillospiraceae bacterium]
MNFTEIKDIIISACKKHGIEEYEVYYTVGEDISAETLKQEVSAFSSGESAKVYFRCLVNGHMGYASSSYFDADELEDLVVRASENAKVIENDDVVVIFKGSESYAKTTAPEPADIEAAELKRCALELQKATYSVSDAVVDGTQSIAMSFKNEMYLYNSHGLELSNRVGMSGCYVVSVVNKDGEARDNFEFAENIYSEDAKKLPEKAVQGALDKIGATEIPTGKYNVVIDGTQMRSLLSAFSSAFSAKNALLGMSRLAGKEGEKIAADIVTITDDPMREGCPVQTPFDDEGVATYKKTVVENGVLKTMLYDLTTAIKTGKETTGNGRRGGNIAPYNFGICAGSETLDELFAKAGDGIYITGVKGLHAGANPITGDFSVESEGFIIKDGKKAGPIKSFTMAGNFFNMLMEIDSLSNEIKWGIPGGFTVFGSPDVLVKGMSIAGK